MKSANGTKFRFGDFELDRARRSITREGESLALNSKTFDLLCQLVENHGTVVTKDELLSRIWPDQFVEENNLTVQISALRKALGGSLISTVPGKGYSFVADVATDGPGEVETDIIIENRTFSRIFVEEEGNLVSKTLAVSNGVFDWYRSPGIFASIALVTLVALVVVGFAIRGNLFTGRGSVVPFGQHTVRQLTTNGDVGLASLSPDGKMFAYTIDDLGQKSLWLGFVEGGNQIKLRDAEETSYVNLSFSPDNSSLYFSLLDERNSKGSMFKIPVSGGVPVKVVDEITNFALSPDGKSLAFTRSDDKNGERYVVTAEMGGSNKRDVAVFSKENLCVPGTLSWSPDGRRMAIGVRKTGSLYNHDIAVIHVASGMIESIPVEAVRDVSKTAWDAAGVGIFITAIELRSLSSVPQYEIWHLALNGHLSRITNDRSNYGASWHNDADATLSSSAAGDRILTVEHRQLTNVWVSPADDLANSVQITNGSFGKYDGLWGLDWAPDGRLIYTTSDTRSQFLAQMNSDGTQQKSITAPATVDSVLTVSTDGRYILFHSNRASELDIWRADIDGTNAKQLTFGGKAGHPAPSPDGRWVYYSSWLSDKPGLWRVPIDGGEAELLNEKPSGWGSFSPDGKYFAASYRIEKTRLAIYSVETNQILRQFDLPKTGILYMGTRWSPNSKAVVYRDQNFGYWSQAISGGEPRRLEGLPKEKLYNFAYSKDGKRFAFVRGQEQRDVVLFQQSR